MRSILALLTAVIYLILSIPILLVMLVVRHFKPEAAQLAHQRIVQTVLKTILFFSGTKITVIGLDNIPADEPVLFVGNHLSIFDIIIAYSQMKTRTGFISKDSLKKIPLLRENMRFLDCLFLDRSDLRQGLETILTAVETVKRGVSIFIFPEGTRNKSGDATALLPFHNGSFKIAQRTGCAIVPVAFTGTDAIFEQHVPWVKAKHVVVEYGAPVRYSDLTKEERKQVGELFRTKIRDMIIKNEKLI